MSSHPSTYSSCVSFKVLHSNMVEVDYFSFPEEIERLCNKYNISSWLLNEFNINRYIHKSTNEEFFIDNHCQCADTNHCDQCLDFSVVELWHNHPNCKVCSFYKKYLLAQCEYWAYASQQVTEYELIPDLDIQKEFSVYFGGEPEVEYQELELKIETAEDFLIENNILCMSTV